MYKTIQPVCSRERLSELLENIGSVRIGLIGDLCLDMYWLADMRLSELSRETPHYPLPVVEERYAPGGAGNAACNIAALKPGVLKVIGLVGDDWRGELLLRALSGRGIDTSHIIRDASVTTNAYIKPLRRGIADVTYEDPRLDFENRAPLSGDAERKILAALENAARDLDVICVSDQMLYGCITPAVRAYLSELGRNGKTVIVDSRYRAADYHHVTVKPNEVEAVRAFADGQPRDLEGLSLLASEISMRNGRLTLITLGEHGCFVADRGWVVRVPACAVKPPIDFCGAGDTFLAGFSALLAAGADNVIAALGANLCSAVTIKKLGDTGTASREEVLAAYDQYLGGERI